MPPTPKTPAPAAPATSAPASQLSKVNAVPEAAPPSTALNPNPKTSSPTERGAESAERRGSANGALPPGGSVEEGKEKGKEKKEKKEKPAAQKKEVDTGISVVDIRVGEVKKVWKHPSADT